ncbi:hypothetical protein M2105_006293 [Paenibacillus sp. PastF-1]|nr:hypothetical protein [Paenibacillus sp. PastF-2]MDF9851808.1 hypothetical protein [Paenibacillus sp. PastM-2]MDF9858377.1 hypothetical protein [Paenibacillus sp. PastF-1]MDH6483666.1 hypothetical protein [Paenibacillus sp. PastH-2]MDH6511041.1 hypothetical protein [Paenibacillus sp. PastM-3]
MSRRPPVEVAVFLVLLLSNNFGGSCFIEQLFGLPSDLHTACLVQIQLDYFSPEE